MCYSTKRKIADCVKELMHHKEIRKITINDIMAATNMSRQSFYYHFKDIYDVLEWIAIHDFAEEVCCDENTCLESWVLQLTNVIQKERFFCEKVVHEIEWPKILKSIKKPMERQVQCFVKSQDTSYMKLHEKEWKFCVDFFSTSFSYYMLDYIYQRKRLSNEEILKNFHFMISMLEDFPAGNGDYMGAMVAAS